jgi:pyruvate,water dikinase
MAGRVLNGVVPFVRELREIDGTVPDVAGLDVVGGKAANLGALIGAGFPVPPGFCVTTAAYRRVADPELLATLEPDRAREALLATQIPDDLAAEIRAAYERLGPNVPVAVRSSATAEDLPFASFAGQQDTFLNVIGAADVLDAVRRCWASLWTDRAVSYRASNGIDHRTVYLAVVVQRMVDSAVSGVMFTANPVTGKRRQVVIDASPGLGEAVVSGAVNPDHFVLDGDTIVERSLGDKKLAIRSRPGGGTEQLAGEADDQPCLTDEQLRELARLGMAVEDHYGTPQDTEWAIDADGALHLTQARPITTLFPLPDRPSHDPVPLHVYFCFSLAQGLERPITPLGRSAFREISTSVFRIIIGNPRSTSFVEAGERIFFDFTNIMRSRVGRNVATTLLGLMEARTAEVLISLSDDPRLSITQPSPWPSIKRMARLSWQFRIPLRFLRALVSPERAVADTLALEQQMRSRAAGLSVEEALRQCVVPFLPKIAPVPLAGFAMLGLAGKLVRTEPGELQTILRGLPNNVTTEMDLALWRLGQEIRKDPNARKQLEAGQRPPQLDAFLDRWGHRAVAEIDLGVPRWSDDPTHIIGVLRNYLRLDDDKLAPDAMFARGAAEAEKMIDQLAHRAGWRGPIVRWALRRTRLLAGLREYPKYVVITLFGLLRTRILEEADTLDLESRDDVVYLTFDEIRHPPADVRGVVEQRKEVFARELRRRHIPRILLSDGTEPEAARGPVAPGDLTGTPASAGRITGTARVVMDPIGAHLEPGEILVAPSTDPGWTPLFLTAGGLVMEMGGANSHGAVVAREYGIPAVVGVREAVARIATGDRISVDGSTGVVSTSPE